MTGYLVPRLGTPRHGSKMGLFEAVERELSAPSLPSVVLLRGELIGTEDGKSTRIDSSSSHSLDIAFPNTLGGTLIYPPPFMEAWREIRRVGARAFEIVQAKVFPGSTVVSLRLYS